MSTHVALRALTGLALVLAACSSSSGGNSPQAAVYPAFTPDMPQLQKGPVQAISTPVLVPVYFPGETQQRSSTARCRAGPRPASSARWASTV